MPSITYPITASYRSNWIGLWPAVREAIYQEFLDLFDDWTIEQAGGRTVVEGRQRLPAKVGGMGWCNTSPDPC